MTTTSELQTTSIRWRVAGIDNETTRAGDCEFLVQVLEASAVYIDHEQRVAVELAAYGRRVKKDGKISETIRSRTWAWDDAPSWARDLAADFHTYATGLTR